MTPLLLIFYIINLSSSGRGTDTVSMELWGDWVRRGGMCYGGTLGDRSDRGDMVMGLLCFCFLT